MNKPENISEIYIFDENLQLLCEITDFIKLEWEEKLYESDSFSIEMKFIKETNTNSAEYSYYKQIYNSLITMVRDGYKPRFITTNDIGLSNIGIIQDFDIDPDEMTLEIKGEGVLSIFEKRKTIEKEYIPTSEKSDTVGEVMCRIINDNNGSEQSKFLPFFKAIEEDNKIGVEIYASCESKDNVLKKINNLAKAYEVGYKTLFYYDDNDTTNNSIIFQAFQYKKDDIDTSISQDDENIESLKYEVDIGKYYNYILVEGDGVNAIVDIRKDKDKEPALETYKKSSKKRGELSLQDYIKLLESEGLETLAEKKIVENFDIEPTKEVKAILGKYYICKIDMGYEVLYKQLPITSITHTIENNEYSKKVSFGDVYDLTSQLKSQFGVY